MESSKKAGSSHGWSSILAGRAVLNKGIGFLVGNGESISVWSHHWLSPFGSEAPIGPPTFENQNLRVVDLMDHLTNEWDLEKV